MATASIGSNVSRALPKFRRWSFLANRSAKPSTKRSENRPSDETIASADLAEMIALHVRWQLAHLGLQNPALERHLVEGFIQPVRKAAADNAQLLANLAERGFELGVVSNGCGNVEKLCADFGYTPFLSRDRGFPARRTFQTGPRNLSPCRRKIGRRSWDDADGGRFI